MTNQLLTLAKALVDFKPGMVISVRHSDGEILRALIWPTGTQYPYSPAAMEFYPLTGPESVYACWLLNPLEES